MAEYVEREQAINFARSSAIAAYNRDDFFAYRELNTFISTIILIPAADVAPVVHGHWIKTSLMFASSNGNHGNVHVCSNCGEQSGVGFKTPYCAICGAKMDEKEDNQ